MGQPETWFVELDCALENSASSETYVRGQLEEVLPDDVKPYTPRTVRQFSPLSDDETFDSVPGSDSAVWENQVSWCKSKI
jgi:hypothetical protein